MNSTNQYDLTSDYSEQEDSERSLPRRHQRDSYSFDHGEDDIQAAPMTPRDRYRERDYGQQDYLRDGAMTPTARGGNEISPTAEAFLSMAEVASVDSDHDPWGDSPVSPYQGNTDTAAVAATTTPVTPRGSAGGKPQAIPSSNGDDEFLAVPSEVKIMSPG